MKKRILAGILSLTMVAAFFMGCTKKEDSSQEPTTTPDATEETPTPGEDVPSTPTPTLPPVTPEAEGKSTNIYVILPSIEEGDSATEARLIQEKAEELGYTVKLCEHGGDAQVQTEQFNEAIKENAQGIICDNADANITLESVAMAKRAGIPTILINRGIDATGVAVSQILANVEAGAEEVAKAFESKFGTEGLYVELIGDSANINALAATDHFHMVMDMNYDAYVDRQEFGNEYDLEDSKEKIRKMLEESPDSRGIVCFNDVMAQAAADVVEEQGLSDMTVVCLSGSQDTAALVKEGRVYAAAINPVSAFAVNSITQMHKYLTEGDTGEDEVQYIDCSVVAGD